MKRSRRHRGVARVDSGGRPAARGADADKRGEPPRRDRPAAAGGPVLWGRHAVEAALANPARRIERLLCGEKSEPAVHAMLAAVPAERRDSLPAVEVMSVAEISALVPDDAVHQGLIAVARPLATVALEDVLREVRETPDCLLVVLDQVTDPHNVGAVLRSAAAFRAAGVILQSRHAPPVDGVLAKAASGAVDRIPLIEVTNIARTLGILKEHRFWCVGLAGEVDGTIDQAALDGRITLVLGAEGPGLRRLTRETCDQIVRLPTAPDFGTLNISNAAAIALYEVRRRGGA